MVIVEVTVPPLAGVTDAGENVHVELIGWPEQLRLTAALKPFRPPTVKVKAAG
jgi:hypothetical protein